MSSIPVSTGVCALALAVTIAGGCSNTGVITEAYATLAEAQAAGAVDRGWLPRGLPPGTRELRVAHDENSHRRWGLYEFPPDQGDALRPLLGAEMSFDGLSCNPPRRIEWWPVLLRAELDGERLKATGLRVYAASDGDLIHAVNWAQGRGYYWSREQLGSPSVSIGSQRVSGEYRQRCQFEDVEIRTGRRYRVEGSCFLTAVYENWRWWLCDSHFQEPIVVSGPFLSGVPLSGLSESVQRRLLLMAPGRYRRQ